MKPIMVDKGCCWSKLYFGNCFEVGKILKDESIDLILTDPPFGVEWTKDFSFSKLWVFFSRIIKPSGAIIIDANQPYAGLLVASNIDMYQHSYIWKKDRAVYRYFAQYRPMMNHIELLVFSKGYYHPDAKVQAKYHPQAPLLEPGYSGSARYPQSVIYYSTVKRGRRHPGQKPIGLLRWFIRSYTDPGDVVFDGLMGSGAAGVAANLENRNFVGVEIDKTTFERAVVMVKKSLSVSQTPKVEALF